MQPPDEEIGEHEPKPADFGHTMVYSADREARKLVQPPSTGPRDAGQRRPADGAHREPHA